MLVPVASRCAGCIRNSAVRFTSLALYLLVPLLAPAQVERKEVNFDFVVKLAEERARKPFESPRVNMPEALREEKLNYDEYRKIRFRSDRALWLADKLPFRVEFFHPGYIYQEPVRIHEFTKTHTQRIRFAIDFFDYSDLKIQRQIPADLGYAGFKLAHSLGKPGDVPEFASFLGASYFRMLGTGQRYGASARGLALDCGEPDRPEEFPIFTDFWLGKPESGDTELRVYAVLDSVSCAGAFEFRIRPGETTVADVEAMLFFREEEQARAANQKWNSPATIGLAPLTSMFLFGENTERKPNDYRPEVHDSDGLLMRFDSGETIWRPLDATSVMRHSVFATKNVRGFGLLQRDRDFSHYEDLANAYYAVPSVWVKPKGDWGEGEVHLVELPPKFEGFDNVVVFWNPKQKPAPMQPFRFGYELLWTRETDFQLSDDRVVATRIGLDSNDANKRQMHLDFSGKNLDAIPESDPPEAVASCNGVATIYEKQVLRSPLANTWRVMLKFEQQPGNKQPVDLRCTLRTATGAVSGTWAYLWSPP
jgi:glucans biosynthesis protein